LITREIALGALELLEIDACGFDKMDRAILSAIIDKFDGGPVGVDTIGDVYEPYLLQEGSLPALPAAALPPSGPILI
jgi:holliday junction DNA helicase RuvB